jgi:hypothetical protein
MSYTEIALDSQTRFINKYKYFSSKVLKCCANTVFISVVNILKVIWDPTLHENYLHCMLPYSKFSKDGLMIVKLPKYIIIKLKIKQYIVVVTGTKILFCCLLTRTNSQKLETKEPVLHKMSRIWNQIFYIETVLS